MNTNSKKVLSFILVFVLTLSCIYIPAGVKAFAEETTLSAEAASEIESLRQEQQAIDGKINDAQEKIDSLNDDMNQQSSYVKELNSQIDNYQSKINVLNDSISALESDKNKVQSNINNLNSQIAEIEENINHNELEKINTQQEIEDVYEELKERLCSIYMNGSASDVEILLTCEDFSSFLLQLELTSNIAQHDSGLVDTLNSDIKELNALTESFNVMISDIEVKKTDLQSQIDVLDERQNEIEKSKSTLEEAQGKISSLQSEAVGYLNSLDKQSDAYQSLVNKYESERSSFDAKIDAIIANASKGSGVYEESDGFIWPLQYSDAYISSPFGYRSDPISGAYKLHAGTDTCCRSGTYGKAVSAAASGTVIISTYSSSYGYYVGIDHGNGFVTVYAHNSSLCVSVGQTVKQGQTVAYAGATGYATGAHVHFEIRVNGTKVNPLNYVSP